MTDTPEIAAETMLGDLTSAVLDEIKQAPAVWDKMSESQQDEVIERLHRRCDHAIRQAVHIIASEEMPTLKAVVDQVVFKDGVKATLSMSPNNPARHDLADAQGETVLIVISSAEQYTGGEKPEADPDQPEMGFDDAAEG